jgi:hypothetical protein
MKRICIVAIVFAVSVVAVDLICTETVDAAAGWTWRTCHYNIDWDVSWGNCPPTTTKSPCWMGLCEGAGSPCDDQVSTSSSCTYNYDSCTDTNYECEPEE